MAGQDRALGFTGSPHNISGCKRHGYDHHPTQRRPSKKNDPQWSLIKAFSGYQKKLVGKNPTNPALLTPMYFFRTMLLLICDRRLF